MNTNKKTLTAVIASAGFALSTLMPATSFAQGGILHRHPKAAGVIAGIAAHHAAKKGAQNRTAQGRRPNFAERHPILSGVAAGAATHHILKKH